MFAQPPMDVWPAQKYSGNFFGSGQSYGYGDYGVVDPGLLRYSGHPAQYPQRNFHYQHQPFWTDQRYHPNQMVQSYSRPVAARTVHVSTQSPAAATIPDAPRGPPRKPKQTGHAVWIGNLPVNATIHELKDYCSRGAPDGIESVFLISKSNCAFANYSSHAACEVAMMTFRDSLFRGRRLVCRLRMQPGFAPVSSPSSLSDTSSTSTTTDSRAPRTPSPSETTRPLIVGSDTPPPQVSDPESKTPTNNDNSASLPTFKIPERFFLIKSLTIQDLLASVNNGTWEAQAHNEDVLHQAFEHTDNVYLIFSANKSGEYFGLARMTSSLYTKDDDTKKPTTASAAPPADGTTNSTDPHSILTPANDVAPSGKIYDDSVRGTIFWEADRALAADLSRSQDAGSGASRRQFNVEWLSTSRVPFFRTRGLRNPWNGLKEVKIARDGTEVEPNVGRHLVRLFC